MKKYIILSMTLLFLLTLAACGDKTTVENETTTEKASSQASDTTVYDDGFGEIVDGTEAGETSKENNSTTKTVSSSTKKNNSTTTPESANTSTNTKTTKTTTTKSSNSTKPTTTNKTTEKTSEPNSGGLRVEEFNGGDSEDFGELF